MNTKLTIVFFTLVTFLSFSRLNAQITERERPKEWNNLVQGGRFMDRFLPIPTIGNLTKDTWGADDVVPRFVDNGIEDADWSYWGGNSILGIITFLFAVGLKTPLKVICNGVNQL